MKAGDAFPLIATGYFLGAGVMFVPMFAIFSLVATVTSIPVTVNGKVVEGGFTAGIALAQLALLPVILAVQAVIFGLIGTLGLWLYTRWRPIRITTPDAFD